MNLYLRLLYVLWKVWRLPRKGLFDESRVTFRVLPTDCDINFHMEQRFESHGTLCAHAFAKGLFLEKGRRIANSTVVAELGYSGAPPPMPEELRIWAELGSIKKQNA